jgi:hypothetical protein
VIDCSPDAEDIDRAIARAMELDCSGTVNPFGDGHSSERIMTVIRQVPDLHALLTKRFHDVRIGE